MLISMLQIHIQNQTYLLRLVKAQWSKMSEHESNKCEDNLAIVREK